MVMSRAGLYFRTLRHLKPIQVIGRLSPRGPCPSHTTDVRLRIRTGVWTPSIPRPDASTGGQRFRFLNEEREIHSWNDRDIPRLWLYNLHYFEHPDERLIQWWIAENPPEQGTGWEPYP